MVGRPRDLQTFIEELQRAILARARAGTPERDATKRIFAALEIPAPAAQVKPRRLPACVHLEPALATASRGRTRAARVGRALSAIAPRFSWYRRIGADQIGPPFYDGHANAIIAGPQGLEPRDDVQIGVSLVAPDIRYPDHQHAPEEVYLVLSSGAWRQENNPWHEPGFAGIVYNPHNIVHAMLSYDAPLLAVWCLWLGD